VTATRSANPALAALWARANIRDLEDQYVTGQTSLEKHIIDTSLRFGVLSRFTAFVAVDQRVVNEGGTTRRMTQPVDLPSGWEVPSAAPARAMTVQAGRPTFGAMARFSATESSGSASLSYDTGYGGQQGGFAPRAPGGYGAPSPGAPAPAGPRTPPVVPPPIHSTPPPPMSGDVGSLKKFVTEELARLRGNDGQDVWLRAGLLTALSERIRIQLAVWQQNNEPADARNALGTLSTELATPTADPVEVDRRWQKAIATLESLANGGSPRGRRAFWKR
jgi:Ca-activated chloride channel family protein